MSYRSWLASLSGRTRLLFYAGIPGIVGGLSAYFLVYISAADSFLDSRVLSREANVLVWIIFASITLEAGAFVSWKAANSSELQRPKWTLSS